MSLPATRAFDYVTESSIKKRNQTKAKGEKENISH